MVYMGLGHQSVYNRFTVGQDFFTHNPPNNNVAQVGVESLNQAIFCLLKGLYVDDYVRLYYRWFTWVLGQSMSDLLNYGSGVFDS